MMILKPVQVGRAVDVARLKWDCSVLIHFCERVFESHTRQVNDAIHSLLHLHIHLIHSNGTFARRFKVLLKCSFLFLTVCLYSDFPKNLIQFFLNLENDFLQNKIPRNYHLSKGTFTRHDLSGRFFSCNVINLP